MIWYGMDPEPMQLRKLKEGDWFGIVCMAVGLGSLEVVLEEGERKDWFGSNMIVNLAIAAAIFIRSSSRSNCCAASPSSISAAEKPHPRRLLLHRPSSGFGALRLDLHHSGLSRADQGYDATQIGIVVMWIGLPQLRSLADVCESCAVAAPDRAAQSSRISLQ